MATPRPRYLLCALALAAACGLRAQDLHYSLTEFMPTWVNPALTGAYNGTVRVGGVYRDQTAGAGGDANYRTPGAYVDAPVAMLGKKAWLGVGGTFINDDAGTATLTTTYAQLSAGYHRIVNAKKNRRTVFSVGLTGGILNRSLNLDDPAVILAEEQDEAIGGGGLGLGAGTDRMGDPSSTGIDVGLGVTLARQLDADRNFRIGVSARHVTSPEYSLVENGDEGRPVTVTVHGAYRQLINDAYVIEPRALVQTTQGGVGAQVQAMAGTFLDAGKERLLKVGLGVRLPARFVYPMVGFDYKDFKVAAAFDISANQLQSNAEGFQRGFELGVMYTLKRYKEPTVDRVILCPQI